MIRQYGAQRFKCSMPMVPKTVGKGKKARVEYVPQDGDFGYRHRVGTIPIGTVVYLQDGIRPFRGFTQHIVCRDPWIIQAWLNREYYPGVKGTPHTKYLAGGHLALVKSLRTGRVQTVSDFIVQSCVDEGLDYLKETWRKRIAAVVQPPQYRRLRYAA